MIIAIASFKGGAGKTTTTINLAVNLKNAGFNVAILDADSQQASLKWSQKRTQVHSDLPQIPVQCNDKHTTIAHTIRQMYNDEGYDILLIDNPPSINKLTTKVIASSHLIIVPISVTGAQDTDATRVFLEQYQDVLEEEQMSDDSPPLFFLVNKYNNRISLNKLLTEDLEKNAEEYKVALLDTRLHNRTAYGEATTLGQGVFEGDNPKAVDESIRLANEIIDIKNSLTQLRK